MSFKAAADLFNRDRFIARIKQETSGWDVIVIGGGATGLGVAVDAASRGYKTLLLEQSDFAKGTSSRSTKLVHGGVRYLAQGNIRLVYEALHERGILLQNAPHLVHKQPFVIPCYSLFDTLFYGIGLKLYDWMAGKYSFGKTQILSKKSVINLLPTIAQKHLQGGVMYFDGQFDDARLAINLAQTCAEQGGVLLNYFKVSSLIKDQNGQVTGVEACDLETNEIYQLTAKVIVNATGVFVNDVLKMDAPAKGPLVRPSQGVHVVLDKSFLKSDAALLIPKTPDERVLFAVPWHDHIVIGTTDTPLSSTSLEPTALEEEITFILDTAGQYLARKPTRNDVLSVFAGLRPLAAPVKITNVTKEISRTHKLIVSDSGLITITGGKWTTYRKMAEDTLQQAIAVGKFQPKPCVTATLKIHGYSEPNAGYLCVYGNDAKSITELVKQRLELHQKLHPDFPNTYAEVVWAVHHEMARTVEDVLARRMRILFLNANAAKEMAPTVATIMATELSYNDAWKREQVNRFETLANQYLPSLYTSAQLNTESHLSQTQSIN
ncbi:glycerol-3-phosphate dehydrogenase/oxidase [Pontibacter sp. H259]|uniref:glycerol-3-phosphate dehydrogenase/oxidase n=1 Tax=Pontibacter sp. H259 TaxID=3133421 RepID=UPI0030BB8DA4